MIMPNILKLFQRQARWDLATSIFVQVRGPEIVRKTNDTYGGASCDTKCQTRNWTGLCMQVPFSHQSALRREFPSEHDG
jgi:hypothetical protein